MLSYSAVETFFWIASTGHTYEEWVPLALALATAVALEAIGASALAQRVAVAEGLLRDVLLLPVRDRLGDVRLRLSATLGGTQPALNRAQLAGLVQARPETLTRVVPTDGWPPAQNRIAAAYPLEREFRAGEVLDNLDAPRGYVNVVVAGELQTKYLNQIFVVGRGEYSQLGGLMIADTVLGLVITIGAIILFGRRV